MIAQATFFGLLQKTSLQFLLSTTWKGHTDQVIDEELCHMSFCCTGTYKYFSKWISFHQDIQPISAPGNTIWLFLAFNV